MTPTKLERENPLRPVSATRGVKVALHIGHDLRMRTYAGFGTCAAHFGHE
jgi:hypothetical protein